MAIINSIVAKVCSKCGASVFTYKDDSGKVICLKCCQNKKASNYYATLVKNR